MKPNKLIWAKCPHCNTELNDYHAYPMDLLTVNNGSFKFMKCPMKECSKEFIVKLRIEWTFEAEKYDGD